MKLYYGETLNPRKACAVAKHLNARVEFVRINLGAGEHRGATYLAKNPNGKVPLLEDGDRFVWESNAIMCYLSDKVGADLWPHDERQIDAIRWLLWDANHFGRHAGRLYFQHIVRPLFLGQITPDPNEVADALRYFRVSAAVLDGHLRGRNYVVGEKLSVVDFALAASLPYARDAHIPLNEFPQVARWYGRMDELEAWREPFPAKSSAEAVA